MTAAKLLVVIGLGLVLAGLLLMGGLRWGLGHLPGDIMIERGSTRFYFPIGTCIVVSVGLSLILWLAGRL